MSLFVFNLEYNKCQLTFDFAQILNKTLRALKITCSKDARLPVQLQRAMAAEAEAAREARAKVISEFEISFK